MLRRKFWGWGLEGQGLNQDDIERLGTLLAAHFGLEPPNAAAAPRIEDVRLREPRLRPPDSLAEICSIDKRDRAEHTLGKSFDDLARGLAGRWEHPPDIVAFPRTEFEVAAVLEWCNSVRAAAVPYGGGSSVARGIEPDVGDGYAGAVSVDLRHLDRVLEIDRESRSARIQSGVLGPQLEEQLRPKGLTLRHFPQSFEFSSLGGWIATRSGGHYATLFTHIDDFVESLRALTPRGVYETRRLPGSGAGPDPARLLIGSEGILGVITEAWMRLQDRPVHRASAPISFPSFDSAWQAARGVAQSGLWPANCRLLDANEALMSGSGDGSRAVLIVAFESADHPVGAWMARAAEICRAFGGEVPEITDDVRAGAAGAWRDSFMRGGHIHDAMVRLGMVNETFETAITWDRFPEFHARVMEVTKRVVREVCGAGIVACRLAFCYPDGPAPYYTVIAPGEPGQLTDHWAAIKEAVSSELIRLGGTITHHHAVGRYHRRWYDRERPALFAEALLAAKRTVDPAGIMNPGVLVDV